MYWIGLVGEQGAGKGTVGALMKKILEESKVSSVLLHKFSTLLSNTLTDWAIQPTRRNLQTLPIVMNQAYGEGSFSRAVFNFAHQQAQKNGNRVIILDGVRWQSDLDMLRENDFHQLVYVTANQELRYERVLGRGEKPGEDRITFEEFREAERVATEILIPALGLKADFTIYNNMGLDYLRHRVEILCEHMFAIRL